MGQVSNSGSPVIAYLCTASKPLAEKLPQTSRGAQAKWQSLADSRVLSPHDCENSTKNYNHTATTCGLMRPQAWSVRTR